MAIAEIEKPAHSPLPFGTYQPINRVVSGLMEISKDVDSFYSSRGLDCPSTDLATTLRAVSVVASNKFWSMDFKRRLIAKIFNISS